MLSCGLMFLLHLQKHVIATTVTGGCCSFSSQHPLCPVLPPVPGSGVTGGILGTLREPGVGDAFEAGPGPVSVWMQPTCVIVHDGGCGSLLGNVKVI